MSMQPISNGFKGRVAALAAGVAIGSVGAAGATVTVAGWYKTQGPVACQGKPAEGSKAASVVCLRTDNRGFATYVSGGDVMVFRLGEDGGANRLVFRRLQP